MNAVIGLAGTLALLLLVGGSIGIVDRRRFAPGWLAIAAVLVALNDLCLTRAYGLLPDVIGGDWNWQGKLLALVVTLAIASLPAFGWWRSGITLSQAPGSLAPALAVSALYCAFFVVLALAFPSDPASGEDAAFQLTLPGLEEELFYRGVLLLALDRAFTGRVRLLGVEWGWGTLLSCALFGMAHGFGYSADGFSADPIALALTAFPALIAVWLRLRTGSLLLPVLLHNFGNALSMLL